MIRPRDLVLVLTLLFLAPLSADAAPPTLAPDKPVRGIAVFASAVGDEIHAEEILEFVRECRVGLVVLDFAWITHFWPQVDAEAVAALVSDLEREGVVVAAMYRPRALQPSDAKVHYAKGPDGSIAKSHLNLCLAHDDSVKWGLDWGRRILRISPKIRHLILYNLGATCRCESCRDGEARKHASRFVEKCREAWRLLRPELRIGHVGGGDEFAEHLDFLVPFLSVRRTAEEEPVDTDRRVAALTKLRGAHPGKPLVPLAKICWSSATNNRTEDIVNAIRSSEKAGLGFVLWYYSWVFHSENDRYDGPAVVKELGGDPAKIFRKREAKPAKLKADGRQWIYFDSAETDTGPRLRLGSKEVPPDVDTVLLSYLPDGSYSLLEQLSISLADTNRVLIRFPERKFRGSGRAKLHLTVHNSAMPVSGPFDLAVHRVKEDWPGTGTSWKSQPKFEKKPLLVVSVDPKESELVIDLTDWARSQRVRHGLLLKVAEPVPQGTGPLPKDPVQKESVPWTQPEIRTGTPFSDKIPWAKDLEDALARAKAEKKPILATVTPVSDKRFVSGFQGAKEVWKDLGPHPWGDDRRMAIDAGLVKERAMMAVLFTDPEIAHLVSTYFVPVRIRLYTLSFDRTASRQLEDPLKALGTSAVELCGPSFVFAGERGDLIHACRRMGVFSAPMVREMIRAVLGKAGLAKVPPFPDKRPAGLRRAWKLVREAKLVEAARALTGLKPARNAPWRWEAVYLRAHVSDRLGDADAARDLWRETAREDAEGPWGSRAAIRLMARESRLDEWETLREFPFDPLAGSTETGPGDLTVDEVLEGAVDYLLLQQRADGRWEDPFYDTHPNSGPGSKYDKTVPRTALVVDALMQLVDRLPKRRRDLEGAILGGIGYVGKFADAPQPHTWKLTYALHLQVAILGTDRPAKVKAAARRRSMELVSMLRTIQKSGGWSYMPPPRIHSFNTAPVLLLLAELRGHGVKHPAPMAEEAAAFLEGLRDPDEPRRFFYATTMRHKFPGSSSCRTALCELALMAHAGKTDAKRLRAAVDLFFQHHVAVRESTKVFESYFAPASSHDAYHYYFGHYYAARALAHLPKAEASRHARRQLDIVLSQRELDGSFVDAQMQGKSVSTALALLTLLEDLRHVEK